MSVKWTFSLKLCSTHITIVNKCILIVLDRWSDLTLNFTNPYTVQIVNKQLVPISQPNLPYST